MFHKSIRGQRNTEYLKWNLNKRNHPATLTVAGVTPLSVPDSIGTPARLNADQYRRELNQIDRRKLNNFPQSRSPI